MSERMTIEQFKQSSDGKAKRGIRQEEFEHQATFFAIIDLEINRRRYPFLKFIYASSDGAKKDKNTANRAKVNGMRKGVPDVCVPFRRRGYSGAYIENKSTRGRHSPEQLEFIEHLRSEGFCVKSCYSCDEQIKFLEWYLNIELVK
jgi:hypothetical protein